MLLQKNYRKNSTKQINIKKKIVIKYKYINKIIKNTMLFKVVNVFHSCFELSVNSITNSYMTQRRPTLFRIPTNT